MNDFPEFLKNPKNRVHATSEFVAGLEGYVFDEYMVVVRGQYTLCRGSKRLPLRPGDEFPIPKGMPHIGERVAGTRTIHAFSGKRAIRNSEVRS